MSAKDITRELLFDLYINKELSTRDIARMLNVGQTTVRRKLAKYGITARDSKESKCTSVYNEKLEALKERYRTDYTERSIESGHHLIKVCPVCGEEFQCLKSKEKIYCSIKCSGIAQHNKHINTCNVCGKILSNHWAKYCPECLHQIKHDLYYKRIKTTCAQCGAELEVIPAIFKHNINNFCDVNCMAAYYKSHYSGENSPTWKGGKRHYRGHWLAQRNLARIRDNYTCQLCGVTESEWHRQMDVHHIKNYRLFENKEEANSLDNLVCLCNRCHSFVHSNSNVEKLFIIE